MDDLYVVLERNQASGRIERVADTEVCTSIDDTGDVLDWCQEHATAIGRGEKYSIWKLVPTMWGEDG